MKYDYLIVGAGLFGAVFAREMTDQKKETTLPVIFIRKRSTGSMCIVTEHIFFTPRIRQSGST